MRMHHRLYVALRGLFRSSAIERELNEELRFHFDRQVEANLAAGMTTEQARRSAAITIGNPDPIREASRDGRAGALLRQFGRDVSHGVRLMRKAPGFSTAAIAIVALGVGAVTAIFSVVYGVALKPLPFHEPDRLVNIYSTSANIGYARMSVNAADHRDWLAANHVFEDIALYRNLANFNLTGAGEPERLLGARISPNLLQVLGVSPALGRGFRAEEDKSGNDTVILLSDGLWRRRFGADPSIVGKSILLNGVPYTVVGVMGPDFQFPAREFQVWTTLTVNPAELSRQARGNNHLAVARLKPGVTVNEAQVEMSAIAARIAQADPRSVLPEVIVVPAHADLLTNVGTALYLMLAAVLCLLLVAALNLATLLSARAAARSRELAVRLALGASKSRVALQAMAEILPLLVIGGVAGVALAAYAVNAMVPLVPPSLPRTENIRVSVEVLLVSIAMLSVTGLIAALLPAAQAWSADLTSATREETRSTTGSVRQSRVRNALVVVQIALALPLLVGGVLLTRTFVALNAQSPGFERDNILTAHLAVPRSKYRSDAAIAQVEERILERVAQIPGVTAAGMVNRLPFAGGMSMVIFEFDSPRSLHPELSAVDMRVATADYFKAMGIPILEGRAFDARDTATSTPVGIIDERIARLMWPGESAIGKRYRVQPHLMKTPWFEIIGVAGHVRHDSLESDARAQAYWDFRQMPMDRMALVVRAERNATALSSSVIRAIHEIDPEQPVYDVRAMDEWVNQSLAQRWMNMVLVTAFAAVALTLSAIGVYGVIAFGVTRQRREFGIRLALGASRSGIATSVLRTGLTIAAAGIAIGLMLAVALTRGMSSVLFGVTAMDLVSFGVATATIVTVVSIATFLPARRAAAVDPAVTLRAE
ncbi:MAG TPA: ABC transporter permease [Vicinamibacterales bacterium]|nr:ABC transporter permease [Vicinamibacterales bacterium]